VDRYQLAHFTPRAGCSDYFLFSWLVKQVITGCGIKGFFVTGNIQSLQEIERG